MFNALGRLLCFFSVFTESTLNGSFVGPSLPLCEVRCSLPHLIHRFDRVQEEIDDLLVEDMTSFPVQFQRLPIGVFDLSERNSCWTLSRERAKSHFSNQQPIGFRLKRLDLVVAIDTEAEGRRLTRPVGDTTAVEVSVFALGESLETSDEREEERYLEEAGLKPGKGTTDAQVEFLSRLDGQRLILVGIAEIGERLANVFVRDRTELRAENLRLENGISSVEGSFSLSFSRWD